MMNVSFETNPTRVFIHDGKYTYIAQESGKEISCIKVRETKKTMGKAIAWKKYSNMGMAEAVNVFHDEFSTMKNKVATAICSILNN